tara:strand:+ start:97 stop:408 length:312 start_codon:yes stop_codon:yes gene_type:complete
MWFAYYINTTIVRVYFQKICIKTKQVAKPKEISVLVLIPSPFKTHVHILKITIPHANARNLWGHNKPSKAATPCLVATKNNQLIGKPKRMRTHSYFLNESHTN